MIFLPSRQSKAYVAMTFMKAGLYLLLATPAWAIKVDSALPTVKLTGDSGGLVKGGSFDSDSLKGKMHVLFYVDPDERELSEPVTAALKQAKDLQPKYQSVAIINMAATATPDFILSSLLADSQEENPTTLYVEDKDKVLVKEWQLADDSTHVVVTDAQGKVLFSQAGKMDKASIDRLLATIAKG